jgi:hypothetical protein
LFSVSYTKLGRAVVSNPTSRPEPVFNHLQPIEIFVVQGGFFDCSVQLFFFLV